MSTKTEFPFEKLPIELLTLILLYAADLQYLGRLAQLSRKMNTIIKNAQKSSHMNVYLYALYRRDFPNKNKKINLDKKINYKELYKNASQARIKKYSKLSKKQRKLFSWIRSGDLESIKREKWNSENDFFEYLDKGEGHAISLASFYERKTILDFFYDQIRKVVFASKNLDAKGRNKFYWAAACNIASEISLKNNREFINQTVGANGETMLFVAAFYGHLKVVQVLLSTMAKVDQPRNDGTTPLFIAASRGYLRIVQTLVEANAKVNQPRNDKVTPLYIAVKKKHHKIIKVLLASNVRVDQRCGKYGTPLFLAAQKGYLEIVETLLNANANGDRSCSHHETPLSIASDCNQQKVFTLLKLWQIKTNLKDKPLGEIVIAILEEHIQSDFLSLFKLSFSFKNPLTVLITKLKILKTKNELDKETLINILNQNRPIIPQEKYEFIFKYFLADENQKTALTTHNSHGS